MTLQIFQLVMFAFFSLRQKVCLVRLKRKAKS